MISASLKEWLDLNDKTRLNIFNETAKSIGLPEAAIEKDWWVVRTLELVFDTSIRNDTVFKGGTSLSKAWGIIDRFSEDIDLALDRKHLGFKQDDNEMTSSQIRKLRKKSYQFISEEYLPEIMSKFQESGIEGVNISIQEVECHDQDPLIIEIAYPSVTEHIPYLTPRVLVEIGSRSLIEPSETRSFSSMVGEVFAGKAFADTVISIPTVRPERTFLEKIFLLHEEFQQDIGKIRIDRKSRHLYDLEKMMDTDFAAAAMADFKLYKTIVEHRRTITPLRGINYNNHVPEKINPIPPDKIIEEWERDYVQMQQTMFHNSTLPFAELIHRITILRERVNSIKGLTFTL